MALTRLAPVGKVYASEPEARAAADRLADEAFERRDVTTLAPSTFEARYPWLLDRNAAEDEDVTGLLAEVVADLHGPGGVPEEHARVYAEQLQDGRSVVLVTAPFGAAQRATDVLDAAGPVDIGPLPTLDRHYHTWHQAAPLSDLLGLPVLTRGRTWLAAAFGRPLADPHYLPTRGWAGGLLVRDPTPLSSAAGLDVLIEDPTPLSSKLGMDALRRDEPAPLSSRLGMKVLAKAPAPLSSALGLKPLADPRAAGRARLSRDPAPFSSLLGLPVLVRRHGG